MATVEKAVAVKQETAVPAYVTQEFDDFNDDILLTSSDLIIPRLKLMQAIMKSVSSGDAVAGEYRLSTGELLAGKAADLDVIVLKMDKYWRIKETKADGAYLEDGESYREAFTLENQNRNWNFEQDGKAWKAYLSLDLYLIQANDDGEEVFSQIPMIITLASSAYITAKKLYTEIQKLKIKGHTPVDYVFTLSRVNEGAYNVPVIKLGRETTVTEKKAAAFFRNQLRTQQVKIDGEESGDEA